MRRYVALIAMALVIAGVLTGCHPLFDASNKVISVYASFYPIYALTEAVLRDVPNTELHQLTQPQDGCLRSYQLSDWDMYLLSAGADAVIMGGRGLESFESALFAWGDGGPAVSAVLYNMELYDPGGKVDGESESHLKGANPHLYMSLDGAANMIEGISATMQSLDPGYAEVYAGNAAQAIERLQALRRQLMERFEPFEGRRVILMNEALIYPALDYGLEIADWIDRESGEALYDDALSDCLERMKASGARVALIEKQAPQPFVEALETAGFVVARLDVFSAHFEGRGFEDYIDIQTANAQALREVMDREDAA